MKVQFDNHVYTLASNASIASGAGGDAITGVKAGSYIWSLTGTFGGATISLEALGPDGVTYVSVTGASLTANGEKGVVIGENATLRLKSTGAASSALYSSLT